MAATTETAAIESFRVSLENFGGALESPDAVADIEARLLAELASPVRLLRWAIVEIEGGRFVCEGAYLRQI